MRCQRLKGSAVLAVCMLCEALLGVADQSTIPIPASPASGFIRNDGQFDASVRFYMQSLNGSRIFLTPGEIVFDLVRKKARNVDDASASPDQTMRPSFSRLVFRVALEGGNTQSEMVGYEQLDSHLNRYIGSRQSWRSNVPMFGDVRQAEIYEGCDIRFGIEQGNLCYSLYLDDASALPRFKLSYKGVDRLQVDPDGQLVVSTPLGVFRERPPKVFVETNHESVAFPVVFKSRGAYEVGLMPKNDASGSTR
jgi:hypothetical protein